ncbi:MAG: hypothetical protein HYU65_02805 [Armatimonadetes bacterium]|nr:hypothetical protein [Armatimonadota bacterium]
MRNTPDYHRSAGLVRFYHALLIGRGRDDAEDEFARVAGQIASMYPEIRSLTDPAARLEAARRVVYGTDAAAVVCLEGRCQFSVHDCPFAPLAPEFLELCALARTVLDALVGEGVEQSEWIVRGDPRCTFVVEGRALDTNPMPTLARPGT